MKIPTDWSSALTASIEASAPPVAAAAAVAEQQSTKVEAKIDMSADVAGAGLCPDCRRPMETVLMNDTEVLVCMACRITLPIADQPATEDSASEPQQ